MAWVYFTAYLTGSRPIYKAERDELYDQFAAKLTGCAAHISLLASRMTNIKSSDALSDQAHIINSVTLLQTASTLNVVIASANAQGAFTNYLTAQSNALAGEGLTAQDLTDILVARIDHPKLWNYYKRLIDGLTTRTTAPAPSLRCRSRSASKTKCGHSEWAGYESTPPKIYLTLTLGGTLTAITDVFDPGCAGFCGSKITYDYSGTCLFDRATCSETVTGKETVTVYPTCAAPDAPTETDACDVPALAGYTESFTSTVHTQTGDGCDGAAHNYIGSATATLSNEYTTAQLSGDVDTALAAASWTAFGSGTCSALYDKSADELTITKREFEYKFLLPDLTGYVCYRIDWLEGGVAKSYVWDGSATETPVYSVAAPGSTGTVGAITGVTATCVC